VVANPIKIIRTQKGGQKLCVGGYMYTWQTDNRPLKSERTGIRWRCVEQASRCRGTSLTDLQCRQCCVIIEHNHPNDQAATECAELIDRMKLRAECSRDKPGVIIAEGIQQLANSARAEMPTTSTAQSSYGASSATADFAGRPARSGRLGYNWRRERRAFFDARLRP